ncbi:MAG TPA: efflux RND transporter periplasmic adaptor subunit [Candidatus Limnocylindrales bacterium]|nr:efflux RND transporter periplasmic adaptor subunit [Candidatus Limnocylindrales bacterium]
MLALCGCGQKTPAAAAGPAAGPPPAVPVVVAKATSESVPTELRVVGTVEASSVVQIKSQIAGELVGVNFTEGQTVHQGDLLFRIDPRPYDEAIRQAEAAVARDRAQIQQSEATLARDKAQADYAAAEASRQSELNKGGLTPKSSFDQAQSTAEAARATLRATQAGIDTAKATLSSDEVAVATARLNRSYCDIHAPITGRTGNLLVQSGNLVKANDVPLVVIHKVEPIFVSFSVPEQHLSAIRRLSASRKLEVQAVSQDNPGQTATGSLSVIDNTVDTTTGTIHLKATFQNSDGKLWPGQFVTAVLHLDTIHDATVVPTEAVQSGQQGQYVYAVKPDNSVEIRKVSAGRTFGAKTVIESGVQPGETVVTDGQLRLFPGASVKPVEANKVDTGAL